MKIEKKVIFKNGTAIIFTTKTTVLKPIYDVAQSFYGKAHIEERIDDGEKTLISYTSPIIKIKDGKFCKMNNYYSQTTLRHINETLKQYLDSKGYSRKEWESIPCDEWVTIK